MHEGQQNQRADRGYSHCHEGARGHHVCARHACAPRPRTKGLCVRWCGAHGTVAHAQRGLGLCMRGLVWPSWSATNTPKHLSIFRVALLTNTMACLCAGAACMHAAAPQSVAMISLSNAWPCCHACCASNSRRKNVMCLLSGSLACVFAQRGPTLVAVHGSLLLIDGVGAHPCRQNRCERKHLELEGRKNFKGPCAIG